MSMIKSITENPDGTFRVVTAIEYTWKTKCDELETKLATFERQLEDAANIIHTMNQELKTIALIVQAHEMRLNES